VQAVVNSGLGSAAWAWTSGDPNFPMLLNDALGNPADGLTPYGQDVAQHVATMAPASPCPVSVSLGATPITMEQAAPVLAQMNTQIATAQAQNAAAVAAIPSSAVVQAPVPAAPTSAATVSPTATSSVPVAMPVPVLPTVAAPPVPSPTASMATAMPSMIAAPALPPAEDAGMMPAQAAQLTEAQQQVNTIATELAAAQAQLAAEQ
jgi:hypothetical protein